MVCACVCVSIHIYVLYIAYVIYMYMNVGVAGGYLWKIKAVTYSTRKVRKLGEGRLEQVLSVILESLSFYSFEGDSFTGCWLSSKVVSVYVQHPQPACKIGRQKQGRLVYLKKKKISLTCQGFAFDCSSVHETQVPVCLAKRWWQTSPDRTRFLPISSWYKPTRSSTLELVITRGAMMGYTGDNTEYQTVRGQPDWLWVYCPPAQRRGQPYSVDSCRTRNT